MKRRDFIALVGISFLLPLGEPRALDAEGPIVGFIGIRGAAESASYVAAFRLGLRQEGFEDGRNVKVEYRWAEGDYARVGTFAADLIQLRPKVMYALAF